MIIIEIRESHPFSDAPFRAALQAMASGNDRWERIIQLVNSTAPSDWKIAIIEADMILEEMVAAMGYKGENLGEQLKTIERSDFETLDDAWEAHKVRNQIAHEPGFELTQREAKIIVGLFENVFREFQFI